mgnify:CR=1 FL=1
MPCDSIVAFDEKNTHEMIKTQVSRVLRGDNFVILDSMNFIKGYRYEMYCIARGCRSTRCVVWVDTPMSVIESFNKECDHYTHDVYGTDHTLEFRLLDLACRFEPPSPLTRWDTPLFRVCPIGDTSAFESGDAPSQALLLGLNKNSTTEVEIYKEIPFDAIWESLTVTKTQAKHVAINPPVWAVSLSYVLGRISE